MKIMDRVLVVSKAKILDKNYLEVNYNYEEKVCNDIGQVEYGSVMEYANKGTRFVHEDLINAFRLLSPHIALLCEVVDEQDLITHCVLNDRSFEELFESGMAYNIPALDKFIVTGFTMSGEGDNVGVVLVGRKRLKNKRVLNLVSPFMKLAQDDMEEPYPFIHELNVSLDKCISEIKLYIEEGKCAPSPQLSLFDVATN